MNSADRAAVRNLLTILLEHLAAELLSGFLRSELTGFPRKITAILLLHEPTALSGDMLTVLLKNLLA